MLGFFSTVLKQVMVTWSRKQYFPSIFIPSLFHGVFYNSGLKICEYSGAWTLNEPWQIPWSQVIYKPATCNTKQKENNLAQPGAPLMC